MSTLKEKFAEFAKQEVWEKENKNAEECELIADDYAISFAEWIRCNAIETNTGWRFNGKSYTDTELLEIFKKQKGYV